MPGVAGSAPTVLAAAVASATSDDPGRHRRCDAAQPPTPGRGRAVRGPGIALSRAHRHGARPSVGFTDGIRKALGRDKEDADDFGAQLAELLGYFDGDPDRAPAGPRPPRRGPDRPRRSSSPPGKGARSPPRPGSRWSSPNVRGEDAMLRAIDDYRAAFRPSAQLGAPVRGGVRRGRRRGHHRGGPPDPASGGLVDGVLPHPRRLPAALPGRARSAAPDMTERERALFDGGPARAGVRNGGGGGGRAGQAPRAQRRGRVPRHDEHVRPCGSARTPTGGWPGSRDCPAAPRPARAGRSAPRRDRRIPVCKVPLTRSSVSAAPARTICAGWTSTFRVTASPCSPASRGRASPRSRSARSTPRRSGATSSRWRRTRVG